MMNRNNNVNKKYKRQWDCARGGGGISTTTITSCSPRQGGRLTSRPAGPKDDLLPLFLRHTSLAAEPPIHTIHEEGAPRAGQVVHGWPRPLSLVLSSSRVMHDGSVVMDSVVLTPPEFWVCLTSVLCE